jgi:hypothetical protein
MSWTDQNELMRLGKKMLDATGTSTPSEKSMILQLASNTGVAYNVARDAYVNSLMTRLQTLISMNLPKHPQSNLTASRSPSACST